MKHTLPFRNRFSFLFWSFTFFVLFFTGKSFAQAFTGTYSFGAGGNVTSFAYNGTSISNLTVAPITKNGVTSHSSTSFRATTWPTGSINSGAAGGSVNTAKYFEFTISASNSYTISNPTITFGVSRNSAGPRRFYWASNVDNYATAIPVTTLGSIAMSNTNGVIEVPDNTTVYPDNVVSLTVSGRTSITFRFYAYGSESDSGQGGFPGNLTFSGTLTAGQTGTLPTVSTFSVTNISALAATLGGNVTNDGGNAMLGRGAVYSTTDSTPTLLEGATQLASGSGTGVFSESTGDVLLPNTQYYYRAYATNGIGTNYGSPFSFYTFANVPNAPIVGSPGVNSLTVAIGSGDGNPDTTEYAIQVQVGENTYYVQSNGSLGATAFWQTALNWATLTVSGLTSLTSYDFRVMARNADEEVTDFGPDSPGMTISSESPVLVASNLAEFGLLCLNSSSINSFTLDGYNLTTTDVTIGPLAGFTFSDEEEGVYGPSLIFIPTDGGITETIYVRFTPTLVQSYDSTFPISGGGANVINVSVEGTGINTAAAVFTGLATSIAATGATLSLSFEEGCSTVTSFGIEYSIDNNFTNAIAVTGSLSSVVSGLEPNTQYYFRGFANDASGLVNGNSESFTTLNLSAPTATIATDITTTSFEANWIGVDGATGYRLDVSASPTFGSNVVIPNAFAAEHRGSLNTENWTETAITVPGTGYIGLQSATSTLITPTMNLSNFTGTTLSFRARTQGGVSNSSNIITVSISTDNGATFATTLGTRTPTSTSFTAMTAFDLSTYVGTQIKIRIQTLNANGTSGIGIDDIIVVGAKNDFVPSFVTGYNSKVINGGSSISSLIDTNLSANTTYHYRVRAVSSNSTSVNSNPMSVTTALPEPIFGAISQSNVQCSGIGTTTFAVQGLLNDYSNTLYYSLNDIDQIPVIVSADLSGNAIFTLPLTDLNNGQLLKITAIEITGNPESNIVVPESVDSVIVLDVNIPSPPTVSIISSDLDNTFAYGTSVTFTASAGNLGGGTASYDFKVNGTSVQNGASNSYVVGNLANGNQVSVSITVTGGTCLSTATADSNVITNTVTGAYLSNVICPSSLPFINTAIRATVPSGVTGVLGYRFKVRNNVTNTTVTLDRSVANFNLTMTSIYTYDTTFNVQVAALVDGVEQPYSAVCVVTTPSIPLNQVGGVLCGGTLEALNTRIFATTVFGSQVYRWRVAESTAPTTYYTHTSVVPSFRLTNVPNLTVTYGKSYLVSVQSDVVINGVLTTSSYSTECTVSTPAVAAITPLSAGQCDQTLETINQRIFINSVLNATGYVYRLALASAPNVYYDFPSQFTNFRLTSVPGLPLTFETDYLLSVQAKVTIEGQDYFSEFSTPCPLRTPDFPTVGLQESQCSDGDSEVAGPYQVTSNSEVIYCDFVSGAQYEFLLQKAIDGVPTLDEPLTLIRPVNNFTLAMFDGVTADTDYLVFVKLIYYGNGPEGKDCSITTPSVSSKVVISSMFAVKAYPNPFENNFLIDLTTESSSPVSIKVYDMVGRLVDSRESKASNLNSLAIGNNYPSGVYNVVVTQDAEVRTLRVVKR